MCDPPSFLLPKRASFFLSLNDKKVGDVYCPHPSKERFFFFFFPLLNVVNSGPRRDVPSVVATLPLLAAVYWFLSQPLMAGFPLSSLQRVPSCFLRMGFPSLLRKFDRNSFSGVLAHRRKDRGGQTLFSFSFNTWSWVLSRCGLFSFLFFPLRNVNTGRVDVFYCTFFLTIATVLLPFPFRPYVKNIFFFLSLSPNRTLNLFLFSRQLVE